METKIPFTQLWVHPPEARAEASLAIGRVLDSGKFILGQEVEAFEREFSQFLAVPSGVGVDR